MMEGKPTREFGRRAPVAIQPAAPVKRSHHVALLLMGTFAVGGSAYALMPGESCQPSAPGMAAPAASQAGAACAPRGFSSGGGYGGSGNYYARNNFFSGDSSSGRGSAAAPSDSGSAGLTRGGFGAFARAFTAHFSGGG
jgi:hypothetical protein